MRYGGNADVARAAALLALCSLSISPFPEGRQGGWRVKRVGVNPVTAEQQYLLQLPSSAREGTQKRLVIPRLLSHLAKQALPWFDYPYGDNGDKEEKDETGKVTKERREGTRGYVNAVADWRDAMSLPIDVLSIDNGQCPLTGRRRKGRNGKLSTFSHELSTVTFALPQVACNNLTWHQYRTIQAIVPQLLAEDITDEQAMDLQAQFLAFITVPEMTGETAGADRFRPAHRFKYDAERAEAAVPFWREQLANGTPLFHICFQVYHTAVTNFYPSVYPLLFGGATKSDPLHTVLSGETDTINAVMKYAGYTDQQQVYDANLPFIFGILNSMTKEAKDIEQMNSKIRKKRQP